MRSVSPPESSQTSNPTSAGAVTAPVFAQFLKWLDQGTDTEGQSYLEMRRRLVSYFDRKNCRVPDELADETLNRVARRLAEEGAIESETPAKYCYIVARFVFMEILREDQKGAGLLADLSRQTALPDVGEQETKERMLTCLELCAGKLEPRNRDLIYQYYVGKERIKIENRRALAQSLGLTMNALSIRACRIRDKLEACVKDCAGRD
jgi:DNA-directed RNA polymerase specialized sigma24 family protein